MRVLGHNHVSDQGKSVLRSHFPENLDGQISGTDWRQQRAAPITAKGDEVQVVAAC